MNDEFDYDTHWISQQLNSSFLAINHPVAVGVIKFGLVWDVLAIVYTILYWDFISFSFLYGSVLGLLWVNFAPSLIWYYDEHILPKFFSHLSELIPDKKERHRLSEKYNRFFARQRISVSIFVGFFTTAVIVVSIPILRAQGMKGSGSLFLWTSHMYAAYVGGILGHGITGPITTILLTREIAGYEIQIDPLHPDNLGGLSNVGYISIRTTLLFSSFSLFLPLLFYLSSQSRFSTVIFAAVGIFVSVLLMSFIYPTIIVNRRAQEYRDSILEDLRQEHLEIERALQNSQDEGISELNKRLKLQRVQREYDKYNSLSLYPLQLNILTQLAGSVILPIFFMIVELYLPNLL